MTRIRFAHDTNVTISREPDDPPAGVSRANSLLRFGNPGTPEHGTGVAHGFPMRNSLTFLTALSLVAGCGDDGQTPSDAGPDNRTTVVEVRQTPNTNVDLLFMVDDSPSTADKQQNLIDNFPNFVNRLNMAPGGLPDLHLGIITPDMGTKASGSQTPAPSIGQIGQGGCALTGKGGKLTISGAPITGTFLSDIKQPDSSRLKNYTGDLATVFGQMARVGSQGCGFEQPLAAMRAALENNPANAGFLREDALLAVIFVTDEDDCSVKDPAFFGPSGTMLGELQSFRCTRFGVTCTTGGATSDAMNMPSVKAGCSASTTSTLVDDIAPYRDFLLGLKADQRHLVVGSIEGDTAPFEVELRAPTGGGAPVPALKHSCTYTGATGPEVADPAVRLEQFVNSFDHHSTSTICQPDLSSGLDAIGQLIELSIGSPCVDTLLADADPNTPGVQVDCVVEDVIGTSVSTIEQCDARMTPPCWLLESDPTSCPTLDHLKLTVVRDPGVLDPTLVTRMRCTVQP